MLPTKQKNIKLSFPENSAEIITDITVKYGLKESPEETAEKLKKKEWTNGKKISRLVYYVAINKIEGKALAKELQVALSLPKDVAQEIAQKLKEKILKMTVATISNTNQQKNRQDIPQKNVIRKTGPKKNFGEDRYREEINRNN